MNNYYPLFHTFVGQLALLVILLASLWGIYSPKVNDGILGRMLYMAKALVCVAGFSHMMNDTFPKNIAVTLVVCVALHMVRDLFVAHYRFPFKLWWARRVAHARIINDANSKR